MDTSKIVNGSMQIRQVAPDVWQNFALALRETAALASMEMVRCPPDMLLKAQGMAVMAQEISTAFVTAPQTYERSRQGKSHG